MHRFCSTHAAAPCAESPSSAAYPHAPVLLDEVLQLLQPCQLGTFVDCTLGAGGHSSAVLQAHPELTTLIGFDADPSALDIARPRLTAAAAQHQIPTLHLVHDNFRNLAPRLESLCGTAHGVVDALLVDLGVSSMQLDTPGRGFSFRFPDAPLDMRMNAADGGGDGGGGAGQDTTTRNTPLPIGNTVSAELVLNTWSEMELGRVFREYGEEPKWRLVARRIIDARETAPLKTIRDLELAVGRLYPPTRKGRGSSSPNKKSLHPLTRVFQALRIAVNDELGAAESLLPAALASLKPGGRLLAISFHSLEDRLVKRAMQAAAGQNMEPVPRMLMDQPPTSLGRIITRKPITAGPDELEANPRARSAKLRCFQRDV